MAHLFGPYEGIAPEFRCGLFALHGVYRMSPWLTTAESCDYLRFTGKHRLRSLYRFIADRGIPTARRGRVLLIARRDLDEAIGAGRRKFAPVDGDRLRA